MQELVSSILLLLASLFGGVLGAGLLFYIRDVWLFSRRSKEERRRAVVQRKLEKLYSPLFMRIKYQDFVISDPSAKPGLTYIDEEDKKALDSTILNYGYLAENELMKLLPQVLGVGFFDERNKATVQQLVSIVLGEYASLRKEYFAE